MAQIYERRIGDSEKIDEHLSEKEKYSEEILIRQYNRILKLKLRDTHSQKLYVLCLRIEFLKRYNKSPILF